MDKTDKTNQTPLLSREEQTMNAGVLQSAVSHEASEDFALPDYMPAIRRVVSVEARALPETRFLSGAALEFGGTVAYSVLYVGEGEELFCAPLTSEYSGSASLGEVSVADASRVGIDTACESVSCRATAPRRLTIRCRMRTRLFSFAERSVSDHVREVSGARLTASDEAALERRVATAGDAAVYRGEMTAAASGTLPLSAGAKIITCSGSVRVDEARAAADSVVVSGDAIVTVLALGADGKFFTASAKAPFSETVSVPGAREGDAARGWGRAAAVSVQATEDGSVPWELEYDLEAESVRRMTKTYTADAYSSACGCETEETDTDSLTLLRCGVGAVSVSGESGRQSKAEPGEYILDAAASAAPDHVERQGKRLILHGICAVSVRLAGGGEIACEEFTLPFRYEVNADAPQLPGDDAELLWRCQAEVCAASARIDGDKIGVNLELCVSMCVLARERIRFVSVIALDRTASSPVSECTVRIVYPDAGEPLWDIGKRYRIPQRRLREANALAEDAALSDGSPLLIG